MFFILSLYAGAKGKLAWVCALQLPLLWRRHFSKGWVLGLLLDEAEVDDPLEGDDLIHVVNAQLEVEVLLDVLNVHVVVARDVLLEVEGHVFSKVSLDHVRERIRQLRLGAQHSPDEAGTSDLNAFNVLELDSGKALLHERVEVELQIHPQALHEIGAGYPGMQLHPMDVILTIGVKLSTIEDQSTPLHVLIHEGDFKVERLLVEDFALNDHIRLYQRQRAAPLVLGHRPLRVLVHYVSIALDGLVICLLERALRLPLVQALLL